MIAKGQSISHGSAMTNYATKHNRADIVLTRNFDEGLTPLAMWGAMETIHQKYAPKFRRKPVEKPTLRMEVSPSLEETKGWTLNDWYDYALRFLDEFKKEVQTKDGKKKGAGKFNLDRAQIFACLHFDAKSGIPHLHILINRIDLDGNLMNDSFVGESATKAAHAINVERGWELPEDIHDAHLKEITDACYYILHGMARYDWDTYKHGLESRGYKVKEQRDKQGVLHGYTILRGNSRFKSSILGKGRDLTASKLEATWKKLHPVAQSVVKPSSTVGTSQTSERKPFTEHTSERHSVAQTRPEAPSVFRKIMSVDDEKYSITMPLEAYKAMKDAIEVPDESVPFENVLNVAMLLFMNYVDAATTVSESCGGGGSTPSNWGKDKDEDEREWARRCAQHANWLCKPMSRSVRKAKGIHR
ncbi:relaxase/mobilization nuclease domain-containing protein [Bacteroides fragilis]